FTSDDGDLDLKWPIQVGLTERRGKERSANGFPSLCHYKSKDYAVFLGAQTTPQPKKYGPRNPDATANAAISAPLPYIMATSRIAHALREMERDKSGSDMELNAAEDFLNRWVKDYACVDSAPSTEMKAKFPVAEAKLVVKEVPGAPG